jgi:hypothetical protein
MDRNPNGENWLPPPARQHDHETVTEPSPHPILPAAAPTRVLRQQRIAAGPATGAPAP